jgi:hypothetical protein
MSVGHIVDLVVAGVVKRLCYLIEIRPGCDYPRVLPMIGDRLRYDPDLRSRTTRVSASTTSGDGELVDTLILSWCEEDRHLRDNWLAARDGSAELSAPQRLKMFFARGFEPGAPPRIALVQGFERIFFTMSRELLAVMRDLEAERLLVTVNESPLTYDDLHSRRSRVEPGFTSDYGQQHVVLTVEPLIPDEARRMWEHEFGLHADDPMLEHCLQLAYAMSGGLPTAFAKAAREAQAGFAQTVPQYRERLRAELPRVFERLLRYDDDEAQTLVEAVARLHLGRATPHDDRRIRSHRWGRLILEDGPTSRLRSEALGRQAVIMWGRFPQADSASPERLYAEGRYRQCLQMLEADPRSGMPLLRLTAAMMVEVFDDDPGNLYFEGRVRWELVARLARDAAQACPEDGRFEFEQWGAIARAHGMRSKDGRPHGPPEVGDSVIWLTTRLAAIERDRNAVTAAYAAVPLIEDILRHYVELVLRLSGRAEDLREFDDAAIAAWWPDALGGFRRPTSGPLTGTSLAVLAAASSTGRGVPLFGDSTELHRTLSAIDSRNVLGHRVVSADRSILEPLRRTAANLLERLSVHGHSEWQPREIAAWLRPPRGFLRR